MTTKQQKNTNTIRISSLLLFHNFLSNKNRKTRHAWLGIGHMQVKKPLQIKWPIQNKYKMKFFHKSWSFNIPKRGQIMLKIGRTNLANAINKVTKEEPRWTNKKLLPFWSICKGNPKQRPCLILAFHLLSTRPDRLI